MKPVEVAKAYLDAFAARDLAEDVTFDSPQVSLRGSVDVLAAAGQFAEAVIAVKLIAVLGDDEQAMLIYDMQTGPFGSLRAADHYQVREGKITANTLVFDTYPLRRSESA